MIRINKSQFDFVFPTDGNVSDKQEFNGGNIVGNLTYKRMLFDDDIEVAYLIEIYKFPEIAQYLSIGDNYFHYVTNTENVYFYKVYEHDKWIGTIHLEKKETVLYMVILVFPEFQRTGLGKKIVNDIQNDVFGLGFDRIEISIDETNFSSLGLFENAGFTFVSKEDGLINYAYEK